ncbi:energy transducer TonB [Collimonas pratensis]|uniref:energy transducer TonB n=1 Tax=Collimonas pratensis TaxID=279113 RepID=UPI0009EDDE33|nr:energy transducer TonB [Collimonas pratensis]
MKNSIWLPMKSLLLCTLLTSCAASGLTSQSPPYPEEALNYGLEGDVVVAYELSNEGRVEHARVTKSSGWKILDDATVASASNSHVPSTSTKDTPAGVQKFKYSWRLNNAQQFTSSPVLIAGSCTPSRQFASFKNSKEGDGLLVRFLVGTYGQPFGIKIEGTGFDQSTIESAVEFIQTCRFIPSIRRQGKGIVTGGVFGRLIYSSAASVE